MSWPKGDQAAVLHAAERPYTVPWAHNSGDRRQQTNLPKGAQEYPCIKLQYSNLPAYARKGIMKSKPPRCVNHLAAS